MVGRIFLALLWAAPVLYAFFFAPPLEPDVWGLILTGMWIALYAAVLLPDALGEAGLRPGPGSFTLAFEGWRESAFLNVMGLDFLALCIAFPFAMRADMHRCDFDEPVAFRAFALLPLIGSALYLLFRPPLVCTEISRPGPIAAAA